MRLYNKVIENEETTESAEKLVLEIDEDEFLSISGEIMSKEYSEFLKKVNPEPTFALAIGLIHAELMKSLYKKLFTQEEE